MAFTNQQFQNAIAYYRGDIHAEVPMPDFFVKLVAYDKRSGSFFSRTFAEIQKNLLMLFAAYDGDFSFAESQEITRLYTRLTALCDENGVPPVSVTPGPAAYLGRQEEQTLTDLLTDMERQMGRRSAGSGRGCCGPAPPRCPRRGRWPLRWSDHRPARWRPHTGTGRSPGCSG